jgi:uncharacterized protein YkwD
VARHVRRRSRAAVIRVLVAALIGATGLGIVLAGPARSPGGPTRELPFHQSGRVPAAIAALPHPVDFEPATRGERASPTSATMPPAPSPRATPASTSPSARETPRSAPTISERTRLENDVVALTNAERDKAGCAPLRNDERLREAARGHSEDMAERNYFAHTSPEGTTPWDRAEDAGYPDPSGENLARGYPDADAVVEAWMDSPGHRANILNCDSKATGVGVELDPGDGPYWTQMFGYS